MDSIKVYSDQNTNRYDIVVGLEYHLTFNTSASSTIEIDTTETYTYQFYDQFGNVYDESKLNCNQLTVDIEKQTIEVLTNLDKTITLYLVITYPNGVEGIFEITLNIAAIVVTTVNQIPSSQE